MSTSGDTKSHAFSDQLDEWLDSPGKKTIGDLLEVFEDKAFALAFLLLMAPSALPIPTGGVTHVLEIITMLLAVELIVGRRSPWLPQRWLRHELGPTTQRRAIPILIRRIRWFERFSRPRLQALLDNRLFGSVVGVVIFGFTLGSFLAPPFSGLDTLPAMGVVVIALSLILEDALITAIGAAIGLAGVVLVIVLGSAAAHLLY
jgi:hypothetical protein